MNKDKNELAETTLKKVVASAEDHKAVRLSDKEAEALREVLELWGQLKAVGNFGSMLGSGLRWVAMFIAAWAAVKAGLLDWLKEGMK